MRKETVPKSEQTDLLSYRDSDSITATVDNYLSTIILIGKRKAQRKPLFKTKQSSKAKKLIRHIFDYFDDNVYSLERTTNGIECITRKLSSDTEHHFFVMVAKLKCHIKQQHEIINMATFVFAEGYKKCSDKQLDYLFGASSMIQDVIKAVDVLENIYRSELRKIEQQNKQAA